MQEQWSQTIAKMSVRRFFAPVGVVSLTIPHSNPRRISPASRTCRVGAKKTMNRKQVITSRVPKVTLRGPKASTSQPLRNVPKIAPTPVCFEAY